MEIEPRVQQPIRKATGTTASERRLAYLGERSFLSLWTYPSVFRDQGKSGGGDGKEVCDLLVVFRDHVLIFSDKDCAYPDTGHPGRDWCRWFRKAVLKSAEQAWGAERWIRAHPDRLFLDRSCTQRFPVELPEPGVMRVHRIVVARAASARCRKVLGGSGSLMLDGFITGSAHYEDETKAEPFKLGDLDPARGFVHVLDDTSLGILMRELDTTHDLVDYLTKKEAFVRGGRFGGACGEEELLAYFLRHLNARGDNDFVIPGGYTKVWLDEGLWHEFVTGPRRMGRVEADEVSYVWDRLIEKFNHHTMAGTSYEVSTPLTFPDREGAVRMMAAEGRTARRILGTALLELLRKSRPELRNTRVVLPTRPGRPHYVLLALSQPPFASSYHEFREVRRHLLQGLCLVTKLKYPDATDIVGVATEAGRANDRSEDVVYFDAREWTPELREEAEQLQCDLGLLTECGPEFRSTVHQFPVAAARRRAKPVTQPREQSVRNSACPCGSGKKWKKCCRVSGA